jgi:ATP phosphoribosyltransferase
VTRLTMALPSKGRLREPSWALLEASGVAPQEPSDRVLQSHCRNADIDLLFVRAEDVPEYVQDGVVDCGITGLDLVSERESKVEVLLRLGFGWCSLEAAVLIEDRARSVADLDGRRIATAHPNLVGRALSERGIDAEVVPVSGSVEISPRLGLADAVVDLVSTGSTLRGNGLRSLGSLFESEAVLVALPGAQEHESVQTLATVLGSVITARANRYVMCNVPKDRVTELAAMLPTRGSPTIMELATAGLVSIHALVPASDIWSLLPKLERCGATSILTLPIERMVQ